jgi:hypothetical protein
MRKRMAFALIITMLLLGGCIADTAGRRYYTSMVYQLFLVYGGLGRESGVQNDYG